MPDPTRPDKEHEFAEKLAELHERLIGSSTERKSAAGEVTGDPTLAKVAPVLDLLEEARECQDLASKSQAAESLVDTRPNVSTDHATPTTDVAFDFGEVQTIGRFQIKELLGRGGFGVVFRATDPSLDRDVALKIPRFESLLSAEAQQRFAREATAAAALNHPNIVAIYESGMHRGVGYIACELVLGKDMASWLPAVGKLAPDTAARIVAELAGAIEHAHRRGVLHRDLKPSNILLEAGNDHPRITDFGLASIVDEALDLTQSGAAVGTPAFMSPEQAAGDKAAMGPATDIYGLGTILYFLLCARPPFAGPNVVETLRRVAETEPIPPSNESGGVPVDLSAICMKCLEKKPSDRYPSAFELQADLERFLQRLPVSARPISLPARSWRWARRNPVLAGTSAVAVLFLLTAVAATTVGWILTQQALAGEKQAKQEALAQTRQAETRYRELKSAIDTYYLQVEGNAQLKKLPGGETLRSELLELALEYYQKFAIDNQDDQELATEIAETGQRAGSILFELGDYGQATTNFRQALEVVEAELQDKPADDRLLKLQAQLFHDLARTSFSAGDLDASLEFGQQALARQQRLCDQQPDNRELLRNLAAFTRQNGIAFRGKSQTEQVVDRLERSMALYEELAANGGDQQDRFALLSAKGDLANALRLAGRSDEAEAMHGEILQEARRLVRDDPTHWAAHKTFVIAALQKSSFSFMRQDFETVRPELEEAKTKIERLRWLHPDIDDYDELYAEVLNRLSIAAGARHESEKALEIFDEVVQLSRERLSRNEQVLQRQFDLASALMNTVIFRLQKRLPLGPASERLQEALSICADIGEKQPENYDYLILWALALDTQSQVALKTNDLETALQTADEAVALLARIRDLKVQDPKVNYYAYSIYRHRAASRLAAQQFLGAREDLQLALPLCPPPQNTETRLLLSLAHERLGESDDATTMIDEISGREMRDSELLLLSKYYALAAGNAAGQARADLKRQAMTTLQQLATNGYFSEISRVDDLESNRDYAAVAQDKAFASSIQQLRQRLAADEVPHNAE